MSARYPGVYKRGTTWSFRAQFGDGDERWGVSGSGYPSAKAASDARAQAIADARPLHVLKQRPDSGITLGAYLETWLADHTRTLRPGTASAYRSRVNMILATPFAQRRLSSMTEQDYRWLVAALKDQSESHTTLVQKVGTLVTALDAAVRSGVLLGHPLRNITITRTEERFVPKWWDLETVTKFLNHRRYAHDPLLPVWHLAIVTGLRRGELHGLREEDVDYDAGLLHVRRQRIEVRGSVIEQAPKTSTSEAPVYLDQDTLAMLKGHLWGEGYFVNDPRTLRPYASIRTFTEDWRLACRNANVPVIRFHDLRHTSASLLAAAGVPLAEAQARLRHWSPAMTAHYTHHNVQAQRTADAIGGLLS